MKRVLFIIQFDSFAKTLIPTIKNLIEDDYRCDVVLLKKRFKKGWITDQILALFKEIESNLNAFRQLYQSDAMRMIHHNGYDLIVVGTSNTRLIVSIKNLLKKKSMKSKIASGYVGALLNNDFESFKKGLLRRSESDLIWAPGSDAKDMILKIINKNQTKVLDTGLPRFDELYKLKNNFSKSNKNNIVFFEQPTFPETKKERARLVNQLMRLAELRPTSTIIIKPRFSKKVGHAHRPKYLLQDMINNSSNKPSNIIIPQFPKKRLQFPQKNSVGLLGDINNGIPLHKFNNPKMCTPAYCVNEHGIHSIVSIPPHTQNKNRRIADNC